MSLAVTIQHHEARPELPDRLSRLLDHDPRIRVVADPDPFGPVNPWRCYRECCAATPKNATHNLIIQDDSLPCDGFLAVAERVIRRHSTRVVAFYLGHYPPTETAKLIAAAERCEQYAECVPAPWVPVVATVWPAAYARELAAFEPPNPVRNHIADDEVAGAYLESRGVGYIVTVPSLVQHDDLEVSTLLGHRDARLRYAACFIGDVDASSLDW